MYYYLIKLLSAESTSDLPMVTLLIKGKVLILIQKYYLQLTLLTMYTIPLSRCSKKTDFGSA